MLFYIAIDIQRLQRDTALTFTRHPYPPRLQVALTPEEAQLVLDAIVAVRVASVKRGSFNTFQPKFILRFVKMCGICEAPDVLISAMYRANELGLIMSNNAMAWALKHFATMHDVDAVERIYHAMQHAGVMPDHRTSYCIIRMYIDMGLVDKARECEAEFRERLAKFKPTCERLLAEATSNPEAAYLE